MGVPSIHNTLYSQPRQGESQLRRAVAHQVIVHVQGILVQQLYEGTLYWVIHPLIHLRPDALDLVILNNKNQNMRSEERFIGRQ